MFASRWLTTSGYVGNTFVQLHSTPIVMPIRKLSINRLARRYDIKLQILRALLGMFILGICSASVIYYYQQEEIELITTASRMVRFEHGVTRWEQQLSRTKLVGTKVARAHSRYKGELAYLNDLQSTFWQKLVYNEQILADSKLSNVASLTKSADAVIDSWHDLQQYHEALLINDPTMKRLDRKAYKQYRASVKTFHAQLLSSINAFRHAADRSRNIQLAGIIVFCFSILVFFVGMVFYYLRAVLPGQLSSVRAFLDQEFFGYTRPQLVNTNATQTKSALTTDEYKAYISSFAQPVEIPDEEHLDLFFDEEEVVLPLREVKTRLPEDLEVQDFGITTVTDFSTMPEAKSLVVEDAELLEELEQETTFLGFDENNTYYAVHTDGPGAHVIDLPDLNAEPQDRTETNNDLVEPLEMISLSRSRPSFVNEMQASHQSEAFRSETWFEFSLPSDLQLTGKHPIWISAVGSKALGYQMPPATTFAALLELFHPDERFTFLQVLRTHLQDLSGETPLQMVCRLKQSTGEYIRVDLEAATERTENGHPMRLRGFWTTLNDFVATPSHVPPMGHFRREGFDVQAYTWELPTSFLVQDYDICVWSEGFAKMLGYGQHNMPITCQDVRAMIHPEDFMPFVASWTKLLNNYEDIERFDWIVRLRNANGDYTLVTMQGVIMNNILGQPYRLAGVLDKVTTNYDPHETRFDCVIVRTPLPKSADPTTEASHRFIRRSA